MVIFYISFCFVKLLIVCMNWFSFPSMQMRIILFKLISIFPILQGTTRLLLTKIPFYKEVILMSFECPECGYKNNEIQSGQEIQDRGLTIKVLLALRAAVARCL